MLSIPKITKTALMFILFFALNQAYAQDRTLFDMRQVPQSSYLNPAVQPIGNFNMNFFLIPSFSISANNNGFAWNDLIHKGTGAQKDSLVLDFNNLESNLKAQNYFRQEFNYDILNFGFRTKSFYFSFGISAKQQFIFGYPKDIVSLKNGNWDPITGKTKDIILSGLSLDAVAYNEISFGISKEINSKLTIGIRPKILFGVSNFSSTKTDMSLITNTAGIITAKTDVELNSSAPMEITRDANGNIKDFTFYNSPSEIVNSLLSVGNKGFGIDIGAVYKVSEALIISTSLVDLGYINWTKNTFKLSSKGTYVFNGTDISSQFKINNQAKDPWTQLGDTLEKTFKPKDLEGVNYTSSLFPKFYASVNYNLNEKFGFGVLSRSQFIHGNVMSELTFSMITNPAKFLGFNLSYSLMSNSYDHVGAGLSLRFGAMQFYCVSDNITAAMNPHLRRAADFRFGVNLIFGEKPKTAIATENKEENKEEKKKKKDKVKNEPKSVQEPPSNGPGK